MTTAQVIVVLRLLSGIYGVNPDLMQCVAYRESAYNVEAVNGVHKGIFQYRDPEGLGDSTWDWMASLAAQDPLFLHADLVLSSTPWDPIAAAALTAWAVKNGHGEHWSTWSFCGGE